MYYDICVINDTYMYMYRYRYMYMYVCVYIYIYTLYYIIYYMCMCMCIYIYIYIYPRDDLKQANYNTTIKRRYTQTKTTTLVSLFVFSCLIVLCAFIRFIIYSHFVNEQAQTNKWRSPQPALAPRRRRWRSQNYYYYYYYYYYYCDHEGKVKCF